MNRAPSVGSRLLHRLLLGLGLVAIVALPAIAAGAVTAPKGRQKVERYVEAGLTAGFDRPGCRLVPAPARNDGMPPQALPSILGVLRSSPTPGTTMAPFVTFGTTDLYTHYVRLARRAFGINWYVLVAGPYLLLRPPRDAPTCIAALRTAFHREERRVPTKFRSAARRMFNRDMRQERTQFAFEKRTFTPPLPVGAELVASPTLNGFVSSSAEVISHNPPRQAAAGVNATEIEDGEAFNVYDESSIGSSRQATILSGIVPDGVATVTIFYPALRHGRRTVAPAFSIRMHAIGNVVVASLPRPPAGALVPRQVWRAADGHIVKVLQATRRSVSSPGV